MEIENQNMLAAGKKSVVKRSGNALQDTANTTLSTVKSARSIFHQGYLCAYKNRYSNGNWLRNCKYNRGKTACATKLHKKLDGAHVMPGAHADTCLMKIDQVTAVKIGVSVLNISKEMKTIIGNVALKNLLTAPSPAYQIIKKHFDGKYGTYKALNDKQVISRVKNTRSKMNSNDIFRTIELGSVSKLEDTDT